MNLLFDTNIIIYLTRDESEYKLLDYINPEVKDIHVSYVTIAEVESIAFQNNWGNKKIRRFESILDESQIVKVDDFLLKSYIEIDAYSQKRHPEITNYPFTTPRNMGKNDLWIAATASLLNLSLITTDGDFDHLHESFLHLRKLSPTDLQVLVK